MKPFYKMSNTYIFLKCWYACQKVNCYFISRSGEFNLILTALKTNVTFGSLVSILIVFYFFLSLNSNSNQTNVIIRVVRSTSRNNIFRRRFCA